MIAADHEIPAEIVITTISRFDRGENADPIAEMLPAHRKGSACGKIETVLDGNARLENASQAPRPQDQGSDAVGDSVFRVLGVATPRAATDNDDHYVYAIAL